MPTQSVLPGLDVLQAGKAPALVSFLRSKPCALLSNPTGVTRDGVSALEVLQSLQIEPRTLFSPEHGPKADKEGDIADSKQDDIPIFSLYGATRRPTPQMLDGLGAIICDLQDVGARFYTYASTIFHILEAAVPRGIHVVVLDRPNPLGGLIVEGPLIEPELYSFIGYAPLPVTHGLTLGELARFFVQWKGLDESFLHIAPIENWERAQRWNETDLTWRRPSPNLPDFKSAAWYAGLALLEFSGVCVGRGTEAPFQILAAPWLNSAQLIAKLPKHLEQLGIYAEPCEVVPTHATFESERCRGVYFKCQAGESPLYPVEFGLCVMAALRASHPDFSPELWNKAGQLLGSKKTLDWLWNGELDKALESARHDAEAFRNNHQSILLY